MAPCATRSSTVSSARLHKVRASLLSLPGAPFIAALSRFLHLSLHSFAFLNGENPADRLTSWPALINSRQISTLPCAHAILKAVAPTLSITFKQVLSAS